MAPCDIATGPCRDWPQRLNLVAVPTDAVLERVTIDASTVHALRDGESASRYEGATQATPGAPTAAGSGSGTSPGTEVTHGVEVMVTATL
jgi:hypothetical protein